MTADTRFGICWSRPPVANCKIRAAAIGVLQEAFVGIRVFVVDDLQHMRALLADVFAGDDRFQVVGTAGGEGEAKLWLEDHPAQWDIAVIDLMLADGSGFGVIGRARATHLHGCICVLSSYLSETIERHCLNLGADVAFDKANSSDFLRWVARVSNSLGDSAGPQG
jgi:two-component system, OmpR family, response regulator